MDNLPFFLNEPFPKVQPATQDSFEGKKNTFPCNLLVNHNHFKLQIITLGFCYGRHGTSAEKVNETVGRYMSPVTSKCYQDFRHTMWNFWVGLAF